MKGSSSPCALWLSKSSRLWKNSSLIRGVALDVGWVVQHGIPRAQLPADYHRSAYTAMTHLPV